MRGRTRLEVHWERLARNWDKLRQLAPHARVLPMVKANAYGHGLGPVGRFLADELGAEALGVATLGEAEALGARLPTYVFSETSLEDPTAPSRYAGKNLLPVVHTLEGLKIFLSAPFSHLPLTLKLNTGMNRLGLDESEWEEAGRLIRASGRSGVHHLLSHYAVSYQPLKAGDKTHRQREAFHRGLSLLRGMGLSVDETSLANSGAVEQRFSVDETWVRPGLMLYGPPSLSWGGEIVSSLVAPLLKVFPVKRGTPVGYGVHVAPEDGVVALAALGYGDGFPTQASGWRFMHQGFQARVFGRVNMDMAALFFPPEASGKLKAGDEVRFWDADPAGLGTYAGHMGSHAYQALCAVGARVPRVYLGG